MSLRLPRPSVLLVLVLAVGLLGTAPVAAADDGAFTEPTPENASSVTDGNESGLFTESEEEEWSRTTDSASREHNSTTDDLEGAVARAASDAFSNDSDGEVERNHSTDGDEAEPIPAPFTGDAGEVATLFTTERLGSYVETETRLVLGDGEPSTASETPATTRDDGPTATSREDDTPTPAEGGLPGPLPPGGLALSAGTGVVLLAAVTRQSVLSGLSAGPVLAAMAPAGMVSDVADRVVRLFTPFRYSRYDDSDPLEHDRRRAVFEVIEEKPGTYLSEVSDAADVPLSTARHHVRVLEREDLVASAKVRGKRRFYPDGTEEVELAAAMDDEPTAAVLDALARLGPSSVATLADELGRDSSTITHHLQRLDNDDLVERERDGRTVVNRLAPAASRMLEHEPVEAGTAAAPADD